MMPILGYFHFTKDHKFGPIVGKKSPNFLNSIMVRLHYGETHIKVVGLRPCVKKFKKSQKWANCGGKFAQFFEKVAQKYQK
jgi:hypothetical protein